MASTVRIQELLSAINYKLKEIFHPDVAMFHSFSELRMAVATPQVPKKPNTPWLNFYMANLPKYKKSHPEVKTTQLKKLISEEWKGVPEDTKAPMVALYEKERAKYQQEMDRLPVDVVENIKERRSATRAMKASSRVDELAALEAKLVGLGRQGGAGLDGSLRKR